jgi:Protein of unknown function (DUF2946)
MAHFSGTSSAHLSRPILSLLRAPSRLRVTAILLCLLACTVQSFVAQTHVHALTALPGAAIGYAADATSADTATVDTGSGTALQFGEDSGKHPGGGDSTSCPLCQIVLHGGAAPAPVFLVGLIEQSSASVAPADPVPRGLRVAVSYNWQGRAPPLC